jgi:hypothetical protein
MTSEIISSTIDSTFPIAGQDNDTQGFRDNFNTIKTALAVATNELSDLQNGGARVNSNNNFNSNDITNANFLANTFQSNTVLSTGVVSSTTVSWLEGYTHVIRAASDVTLTITNLPNDQYAQMRIILTGDNTARQVTIAVASGTIKTDAATTTELTVNSTTSPTILEISSYDNNIMFLRTLGEFS